MSSPARRITTAALLLLGVVGWVFLPVNTFPAPARGAQVVALAAALVLACIPGASARCFRGLQRIRRVSPRTRATTTLVIFVIAAGYLTFTAFRQNRDLYPKYHDNQSYAVQAQIIAAGRLWLPPHPHPDFFDTFHVIGQPVYASMYFPGAAMLFAVGVALGLAWWVVPICVAAGCVAMTYRVVAELVDGAAGLLAALWLVSLMWFRHLSAMLMSHSVLLLVALLMTWGYLRWRRGRRLGWALAIGAFSGFAAITRPADALCYAIPIGVAILCDLRHPRFVGLLKVGGAVVAGALPFLAVQLLFNYGVSGDLLTSPYRVYLDRDAPQLSFGFHEYDPERLPQSAAPQKQLYHVVFNASLIREHQPERLWRTWFDAKEGRLRVVLDATSPGLIVLPFALAGLLGLASSPRRMLFATLPLFCLLYLFYAALLPHYAPVVAPAVILLGVLGIRQAEALAPRLRPQVATFCAAAVAGACVLALPEVKAPIPDDPPVYYALEDARQNIPLSPQVKRPALVFVTFTPRIGANVHAEPVYNYDAARIDDNPIVFAHDLGPRNAELLRYYAQLQPGRNVYFYDRESRYVRPAGTVAQALRSHSATTTQPAATAAAATRPAAD